MRPAQARLVVRRAAYSHQSFRTSLFVVNPIRPRLIFLTRSFPFRGPDDSFLGSEVAVLSRHFDIHFVPTELPPSEETPRLAATQEVDTTLANSPRKMALDTVRGVFISDVRREIESQQRRSPRTLAIVARRWTRVSAGRRWARKHLLPQMREHSTLVYSWWSVPEALGVAEELMSSGVPMVTRMHGYDLYAERDRLNFIPFQRQLIDSVSKVYSASQAGEHYLRSRYPDLSDKVSYAYLGVDAAPGISQSSNDGILRVVSCSSLLPVKRVDLLVDALLILRARGVKFEWTHIGDGPDKQDLIAQASPLGDQAHFLGELPHDQVRAWLARNPVDVFCNVSESEGLPVTLMEAASCGIPLFATDVGGNNEIVDESVGRLIPGSAGPDLVADMLSDMAGQSETTKHGWRRRSAQRWASSFDAERNYEKFAEELLNVLQEKCVLDPNSARLDNWKESF